MKLIDKIIDKYIVRRTIDLIKSCCVIYYKIDIKLEYEKSKVLISDKYKILVKRKEQSEYKVLCDDVLVNALDNYFRIHFNSSKVLDSILELTKYS